MSHTPFCWLMDQTHDGLFALVGRSEDCPICGAENVRQGAPHEVGCARTPVTGGEIAPGDASLVKSNADIAKYVGGLAVVGVGLVLVKFTFDAVGKGRVVPDPLPPRYGP
jgi:hypothetical protein